MELFDIKCPNCSNSEYRKHSEYDTKSCGIRELYECKKCLFRFSETKNTFMENLKTPISVIWKVIKARTEGMTLNAAARTFEISKNTIISWERRFDLVHKVLFIYSLTHEFLKSVIEGDELYTKTGKNVSPDQSQGWTIVLMDRAARFIWELRCGKKDRKLFYKVIRTLEKVIGRSTETNLFTDGERRYGSILFEICNEVIHNGKRGRPVKTLKPGVVVMLKNKGSQKRKPGRKRPKYQSPIPGHPRTTVKIEDNEIHANHVEAFNSSLRRKISAFRRRTNTFPKDSSGLQRVPDMYWVIHNFVTVHFTTKQVPAVAMGIMDKGLSMNNLFKIQLVLLF